MTEAKKFSRYCRGLMVVDINDNCQGQFVEARFLLAFLFRYFNNERANKASFSTIFLPKKYSKGTSLHVRQVAYIESLPL